MVVWIPLSDPLTLSIKYMPILSTPTEITYRVLYVDDEPTLLEIGKLYLEQKWKFVVTTVQSANDALDFLILNQYDAIVSDYQMPGMDGIELLHEIRSRYSDLPFILFTGRGREEVVIKALNAGADFYLQKGGKPKVQFAELANQLKKAILKKKAEDDRFIAEQALIESEEKYHTIFDSSPYPIVTISCQNGYLQTVNTAFLNLCGCIKDEVIGKTFGELGLFSEYYSYWFNSICQIKSLVSNVPITLTGMRGQKIEALLSTTPVTIKGSPSLLTTIVDITAQNRIIEEVKLKNNELHSAYEQLSCVEEELHEKFDEVRKNEQELRASEKKFRALVENSLEGIIIINYSGDILFLNNAASQLVDIYTYKSLIGTNVHDFLSSEYHDIAKQNIDQILLGTNKQSSQYKLRTRKNRDIWVETIGKRIRFKGSSAVLVSIRDITERKLTEDALMESESKFSSVFKNNPVPLTLVSADDGTVVDVNSAFERETGYLIHEIVGNKTGLNNLFYDKDEKSRFISTLRNKHVINGMEIKSQRKSGKIRDVLISSSLIQVNGKRHILSSIKDITEQKKAVSALKEKEEKFRFLIDCCHEGILLTDLQGTILFSNKATVQMVEFEDTSEVIGRNIIEFIADESREEVRKQYKQIGNTCEPLCSHHQAITKTGKQIYVESIGQIHTYKGNPALLITVRDVTDRLLAHEALKASEMRFRAVSENAGTWIWEVDSEGIYRYSSSVVEQILGYRSEELVGKEHFSSLLDPATRDDPYNDSVIALSNFAPIKDSTILFKHKNGSTVVLNISSTPAYDIRGRISGYYGVSEDITKRRDTESNFQKLIGTLVRKTGLSAVRNISNILRSWLQADCVIVGKLNPDHTGVNAISMILDGEEISDGYYSLSGTPCEKTCEQEFHICTDNVIMNFPEADILKQFKFRGYCGTPIRNYEGKTIGVLCVLSRKPLVPPEGTREIMDIIAGKVAAEIERSQIEDALRESEEKFRMLVDLSLDGIIIIDKKGILLFGNQAAGRIFDLDIEDLIESGQQNVLDFISPESHDRVIYEIGHVADVIEPYTVDYQAITSSGRTIWIEGIGKEILYRDSPAVLLSLRDITLRKQMEDAILRKNKQLNLLSSITRHDILNMIMVIQGSLEIIQMEFSEPGLIEYIMKMRTAADTIKAQIEFTRFYQDMSSHTAQWLDLDSCMPFAYIPTNINFENKLKGVRVYADQMLEKIFFNLLDNSIRHGQVVTNIRVGYYLDTENLIVLWEDNGIGIPMDLKEQIFELGFGKNTGYGLFLVREILSLTGITIKETGKPGIGARFEFLFPRGTYQFT
ncbi:hypothetical protein DK846_05370 [Methanospirillum lacunae]|uniref:histidine kinase n=2 Tax=Methanospirillum lacunae TaxID=668570 RepID=A0A2V2MYP0_9EURY|nr:hypothetical protein DK846_05370 [Methanospirillum lacunae]